MFLGTYARRAGSHARPTTAISPIRISPSNSALLATPEEISAGQKALGFARARIPGRNTNSRPLLFARVDIVTQSDGTSLLMELELIDANLYTRQASGAVDRFADAILAEAAMPPDTQNIDLA